jgi:hypothetical protein
VAASGIDDREHRLVGQVVAQRQRHAAEERRLAQEALHRIALAGARGADLIDHLAELQRPARTGCLHERLHLLAEGLLALGREPVVGCDGGTLVLDQHARHLHRLAREHRLQGFELRRRFGVDAVAIGAAHLGAVQAGNREFERLEQCIRIGQRTAGDQRDRAAEPI